MAIRRTSQELDGLADLLDDFGAPGWDASRVDEAFDRIRDRAVFLETFMERYAQLISGEEAKTKPLGLAMLPLAKSVHHVLFFEILSNAGEYRKATDIGGGHVQFGGPKGATVQPLFRGTPPAQIQSALTEAFRRLTDRRANAFSTIASAREAARLEAKDAAILFYKDFSGVHPFYDANGRTGRYVVSVYLALHGLYARWGDVDDRERKFLKRINECLKRRDQTNARFGDELMQTYESRLTRFWRDFVDDIPGESLLTEPHA